MHCPHTHSVTHNTCLSAHLAFSTSTRNSSWTKTLNQPGIIFFCCHTYDYRHSLHDTATSFDIYHISSMFSNRTNKQHPNNKKNSRYWFKKTRPEEYKHVRLQGPMTAMLKICLLGCFIISNGKQSPTLWMVSSSQHIQHPKKAIFHKMLHSTSQTIKLNPCPTHTFDFLNSIHILCI